MNNLVSRDLRPLDAMNNLGLRMIWIILGHEYGFKCYEKLRVVDDVEDSRSWAQGFICHEQLRVVIDKNQS